MLDVDVVALAGMVMTLLFVMIVGGVILLFPLTRRLGALMEQRLQEKQGAAADPGELVELRRAVESLQGEVARLSEQQAFTESLLEKKDRSLPSG